MFRQDENKYVDSWRKFISGDDTALSTIYLGIYDDLLNFGLKFSTERTIVEDCIQNLFIDLLKNRNKLKSVVNIDFYILKSLRNQVKKEQAKRQKLNITDTIHKNQNHPFFITYSIEEKLIQEDAEKIKSKFVSFIKKNLTPHQKEALCLRYNFSLEYDQVAEIMGIDIASARTLIYRAIKTIKKNFNVPFQFSPDKPLVKNLPQKNL